MEPVLFPPEEMGGVSLEEVIEAYYDCRRNKRNTANQLRFEMDYERECIQLWQEINEHRYEPRRSIAFVVEKPVKREIFAADFRDRVVHHLIVRRMMPLLEAKYHPESYSTQKGKGTLYGIQRIEQQLKECSAGYTRDCYIMKLDISGFFMSLPKQALYDCIRPFLEPRYPARDLPMLLYLLRQTIFNRPEKDCVLKMPRSRWKGLPRNKSLFDTDGTHGIPIGNLTSQLLALLYLDELDTLVTGEWDVKHYGRYVDDMVLIHPSKQHLLAVKEKISQWLETHGLKLHPKKTYVQHYAKGVLFIGGMILPANENGVVVEVHFRPSSGNFNPITNRRLQRWLEREILSASMVEEGFCVPSVRFALVMQLAHVQRHFLASGLGLRHVCDYYWLLQNSTAEDLRVVAGLLKEFGLHHAAGALMWVIGKVLHLDSSLMLCEADSYRGEWMLREIMAGGNFGWYAERQKHNVFRRVLEGRLRHLRLMPFDFWEMLWLELRFWKAIVRTLPTRIRYRTLSLRDIPR